MRIRGSPEFFAAQDFDVTTALLDLSTGGRVRLQVFVVEADLNEEGGVRMAKQENFPSADVCALY